MRALWRVVAIIVAAAVGAVLLPIAINFATDQPLPLWLEPYQSWSWPAVAVLGSLAVILGFTAARGPATRPAVTGKVRPGARERALENVHEQVARQLTIKLGDIARADIRAERRPDAVSPVLSAQVRRLNAPEGATSTTVRHAFEDSGCSLLLLGQPGAGKTTQLLELAADLLGEARDCAGPVPVLIDLGGWGRDRPLLPFLKRERTVDSLREWLLGRAQESYGVGTRIGRTWLDKGELALLLDGLDEVADEVRPELVGLLNELSDAHGDLVLVVASRIAEYERCPPLQLAAASAILPLGREQVSAYLAGAGSEFADLGRALDADESLWEVVDSPFWLHVLASVARAPGVGGLAETAQPSERRRRILDAYVAQALRRPRPELGCYAPEQVLRWLGQFARSARHLGWTTVISPQVMPSVFKGTVPAGFIAALLPTLGVALPVASVLQAGAMLATRFGALSTVALAPLPATVAAILVAKWAVGGHIRWPFDRRSWIVGTLAALPLAAAGYALQTMMADPPLFPDSPNFSLALLIGFTSAFLPMVTLGAVGALINFWTADSTDEEIRIGLSMSFLGAGAVGVVCLPLAVFGVLPWTGPFLAGFAGVWIGTALAGGVGILSGNGVIGAWLPVAVLIAARLLPVRANRFCRFAAATGLLIPAGYTRTAYRFPHMIFVDYFADHG